MDNLKRKASMTKSALPPIKRRASTDNSNTKLRVFLCQEKIKNIKVDAVLRVTDKPIDSKLGKINPTNKPDVMLIIPHKGKMNCRVVLEAVDLKKDPMAYGTAYGKPSWETQFENRVEERLTHVLEEAVARPSETVAMEPITLLQPNLAARTMIDVFTDIGTTSKASKLKEIYVCGTEAELSDLKYEYDEYVKMSPNRRVIARPFPADKKTKQGPGYRLFTS